MCDIVSFRFVLFYFIFFQILKAIVRINTLSYTQHSIFSYSPSPPHFVIRRANKIHFIRWNTHIYFAKVWLKVNYCLMRVCFFFICYSPSRSPIQTKQMSSAIMKGVFFSHVVRMNKPQSIKAQWVRINCSFMYFN